MKPSIRDAVIVIPARYASSRFPGKPLVDLDGQSLIQRVYARCVRAVPADRVYVATDDDRIVKHCKKHDLRWIMTSEDCLTGTDRVAEVAQKLKADFCINVQGDEPLIEPQDILAVMERHAAEPELVHCGMCPIASEEDFRSPSVPKVVCRPDGRLLYMSRAAIPTGKKLEFKKAWKQVCIYGFSRPALEAYSGHGHKTPVESMEDIEILRFLELGFEVRMVEVSPSSIAVDFPEDVEKVCRAIRAG